MRGFLGGVSIGALVAAAGAAMLSLSAPLPKVVDVTDQTPTETLETVDATALPVEAPGLDADLVEAAPAAPEGEVVDDLTALQDADTQSADRPEIGKDQTAQTLPPASETVLTTAPEIGVQTDTPVVPVEALPAPSAPTQEAEIVVPVDPTQPPQPVLMPNLPAVAPEITPPVVAALATDGSGTLPSSARGQDIDRTPVTGTAPVTPDVAESATATAPDVGGEMPVMTAPTTGATPFSNLATTLPSIVDAPATQLVPGESRDAGGEDRAADSADEPSLDQTDAQVAGLPTTTGAVEGAADSTGFGTPVVPLTERNPEVAAGSTTDTVASAPFEDFAETFDNPDGRPLMAIVLIDDTDSIGSEALVGFPYPLSFAIDPEDPNAAEKMAARRAAGFEVLILTDLPREAAPQDAETALAVWFETVPESIAVLEGPGSGFQGNRPLADQVSAVVAASGRGMLTQNHGLNTVQKLAARDGVPAAVVFRDFDGAGQNPKAIRRFLDQAAFRAGQEGAVIMLGRLRPDTISALLLWGLQDRASRVALAPVSAALSLQVSDR